MSDGRRWEKLEELLLMLLRVAAVGLLVLALAQPMVRGSWIGVHDRREVVLVVDDSLSTAAEVEGRTVFEQIQEEAAGVLDDLNPEDRVQLLAAAGGGRWLTAEPVAATSGGKRQLEEQIKSLKPTRGRADVLACLRSAVGLEPIPDATERLIVVVTDGQADAFDADQDAWSAWDAARSASELPISARVIECGLGDAAPGNLAVGRVEASRTVVRSGEKVTLTGEVANFGFDKSQPADLEWRIGDRVIAKSRLAPIAPGETSQAVAQAKIEGAGPQRVDCVLVGDDCLPLDQSAAIILQVSDRAPVLIVEDPGAALEAGDGAPRIAASRHLAAALGYLDGKPQAWRSVYEPRVITPDELADTKLSECRVVVLTSVSTLRDDDVDRLRAYVAAGGGLWATLDAETDADEFNALWHDDGEGLCPLPLGELSGIGPEEDEAGFEQASTNRGVTIHPPDADHPATRNLSNTTQLDIDKTQVNRYWLFRHRGDDEGEAPEVSSLLRTGGGDELVLERYYGGGRVLVQAMGLDLSWSDLPLRKAYVAMVHDWLDYLSAPSRDRHNLAPGAAIVAHTPPVDARVTATVETPSGAVLNLAPRGDVAEPVFRFTQTRLPGAYTVLFRAGGQTLGESVYQTPRQLDESRLTPLDAAARDRLLQTAAIEFGGELDTAVTARAAQSKPAPFWWSLLAAVAALLVGELLLANHVGAQRMGAPATAG